MNSVAPDKSIDRGHEATVENSLSFQGTGQQASNTKLVGAEDCPPICLQSSELELPLAQRILQVELDSLKYKVEIIEERKAIRSQFTVRQFVCGFLICFLANQLLNMTVLYFSKISDFERSISSVSPTLESSSNQFSSTTSFDTEQQPAQLIDLKAQIQDLKAKQIELEKTVQDLASKLKDEAGPVQMLGLLAQIGLHGLPCVPQEQQSSQTSESNQTQPSFDMNYEDKLHEFQQNLVRIESQINNSTQNQALILESLKSLEDIWNSMFGDSSNKSSSMQTNNEFTKEELEGIVDQKITQRLASFKESLVAQGFSNNSSTDHQIDFESIKEYVVARVNDTLKQKAAEIKLLTPEEEATVYNLSTAFYKTYQELPKLLQQRSSYIYYSSIKAKWDELGPLSISEIIWNTPADLIFNPYNVSLQYKNLHYGSSQDTRVIGLFKSGTGTAHGIGVEVYRKDTDRYYEGYFVDRKWNGYGRLIWEGGEYYIGQFRDGFYHGQGKRVTTSGIVEEGTWKYGVFHG